MLFDFNSYSNNVFAIDDNNVSYSYKDLWEYGSELNNNFESLRNLCFILCTNTPGCLLGYTSFLNYGNVPIMADDNLNEDLLFALIDNYKPGYLWVPTEKESKFEGYVKKYSKWDYSLLKRIDFKHVELFSDLALLLTTSGSTGSPKLVRLSYKNIEANTKSIVEYLNINSSDRPITSLPCHYSYGLSVINTHLISGATLILTKYSVMQREFWKRVKEEGVTSIAGVPFIYEMLDRLRFFRMDLPSLTTMTQAGGKLSLKLHEKFGQFAKESGKKFIVMYGQTEATARMAYLPPEKCLDKIGSMGVPIPGGKFSVIDVDDNEITTPETVGELLYKGDNVSLGYAECLEDLQKEDERGGVLRTGDMAKFDSEGYYYIVGRKKRFLKIFGSRVNLDETERLIASDFKDLNCVCGGVDDKMYVFITDETKKEEIKKYLSEKLSFHPSAFNVVVVDEIPRNSSGKILYSELSKYYK